MDRARFLGLWIVMMLLAAIPTVALYESLAKDRTPLPSLLFVAGYLAVWATAGLAAPSARGDRGGAAPCKWAGRTGA